MQSLDTTLFLWLTASANAAGWSVTFATFCASAVAPLIALGLLVAWIRALPGWRPALLDAVAACVIGLGLVQVISWIHYRPRPFEVGLGANLLHHLPENSFPSDHATLMFALAFALLTSPPLRKAGAALLVLALAVSWARIYLGVHYPSDILGGAVLAVLCVAAVRSQSRRLDLWALVQRCYIATIAKLNLPTLIFPRDS